MFLCSWLELKALANLWDSRRQSASRKSWSEARNWYMPWSSLCWLPSWPSSGEPPWQQKTNRFFQLFFMSKVWYTLCPYTSRQMDSLTKLWINVKVKYTRVIPELQPDFQHPLFCWWPGRRRCHQWSVSALAVPHTWSAGPGKASDPSTPL